MPKNQPGDLITDQEIAFVHRILSGSMTDRAAAQDVGLNPDTAAYTKAKPCVRAYMDEHRAAVHQQLVEQENEGLRRKNQWRQQVLDRLWEIAKLPAEVTRGSISGQVKAVSMIVAIEGLIPDRPPAPGTTNPPLRRPNLISIPPPAPRPAVGLPRQQGPGSTEDAPDTRVPFSIKKNPFARRR